MKPSRRKRAGEGKNDRILQRRMKEQRRHEREIAMQATNKEKTVGIKNRTTQSIDRRINNKRMTRTMMRNDILWLKRRQLECVGVRQKQGYSEQFFENTARPFGSINKICKFGYCNYR